MVVVASGEPGVPVVCCWFGATGACAFAGPGVQQRGEQRGERSGRLDMPRRRPPRLRRLSRFHSILPAQSILPMQSMP